MNGPTDDTAAQLARVESLLRAGGPAAANEAEALARRVLVSQPQNGVAVHYCGVAACQLGRVDEGVTLLCRASDLAPQRFDLAYGAGTAAAQLGRIDDGLLYLRRTVALHPNLAGAWNNLGQTCTYARRLAEAMDCFRRAVAVDPAYMTAASNLVYFAHFDPAYDGPAIRREAANWARLFAEPITRETATRQAPAAPAAPAATHAGAAEADRTRRLRIGYVSPDLYQHPVGRFMHAVLACRDRDAFEVVCYSDRHPPDAMTAALRSLCDGWRDTAALDAAALAEQIRRDRIDILVDLSLHMGGNRLLTFARRPAKVQVTYLGYAGTSGMTAMNFRLSDPHLDPPGNDDFYTERTVRLPRSYWCYSPPPCQDQLGDLRPRPADGPITFASMNNLVKVSDAALDTWAQILSRVPASRMIIHAQPGNYLAETVARFERVGVAADRLEFVPMRELLDYFRTYEHVDIALDSFPYAGGTTTCDAMWMGVPTVTLGGRIAVHRGGVSLLRNLGLNELIADSVENYVAAAVSLASSRNKLAGLRMTLRPRMQSSIVMHPHEFMRDLEAAYVQMWSA